MRQENANFRTCCFITLLFANLALSLHAADSKSSSEAIQIPKGTRAYILHMGSPDSSNLIRDGDHVDISIASQKNGVRTQSILKNILVLSTHMPYMAQGTQMAYDHYLTLAVTQQQAAKLAKAQKAPNDAISLKVLPR